jgi:hypothetical protein
MLSSFPLARTQSTHSAPVRVTQSNLPHSLTGVALAAAKKTPRAGSRPRLGPLVRLHIAVCHTSSLIWLARRALRPLSAHADWLGAHSLLPPRSGRSWTPSTRRTRTSAPPPRLTPPLCLPVNFAGRSRRSRCTRGHTLRVPQLFSDTFGYEILWFYYFCYLSLQVLSFFPLRPIIIWQRQGMRGGGGIFGSLHFYLLIFGD